jgi:hypothetical protein
MQLGLSGKAVSCAAIQEFLNILWNRSVHYRVHKRPSFVPTLSQINRSHTTPFYLYHIHFNVSYHLRLGLPSSLFPPGFPITNLYPFLFSSIRATYPVHLIILDLIILIILGEEYKL